MLQNKQVAYMKNLSTSRSNLSKENINILKRLANKETHEEPKTKKVPEQHESIEVVHDNALGVLYKSFHTDKSQQKPMIYFFAGLLLGIILTLIFSAVVLVSDKDTIQNDVKTVKENIIENQQIEQATEPTVVTEVSELSTKEYIVKQGDTLGGIVNRIYGESSTYNPEKVERFKEVNGLKSIHQLKIGQKLIIPD